MKNNRDQESLFGELSLNETPLAKRMRPSDFDQIIGQRHFLNERFRKLIESDKWVGLIFWGPPGTGKTTLAAVIAQMTHRPFDALSAVTSGVKEIREVLERSKKEASSGRTARILFIDEVHRLNKAQQDVLLPFLEEGSVRFIGATTENPSFEINNAIASRTLIFHFDPLGQEDLLEILKTALPEKPSVHLEVLEKIAAVSLGDARRALTLLEHLLIPANPLQEIGIKDFEELTHSQSLYYDKKSESHYDTISAFIKSVRGSDPDASVYYLARMLEAGEDPKFIARRLIILAAEDIGNANPMALVLATEAFNAVHFIGMPEARIILSQVTTYLCCSEKSNRSYLAIESALEEVRKSGNLEIPLSIRNAPTALMKEWGYGRNYQYPHEYEQNWIKTDYLPSTLKDRRFYHPGKSGVEKRFQDFLQSRGKEEKSEK